MWAAGTTQAPGNEVALLSTYSVESLTATLALIGIVILVSALIGGWEAWQKAALPTEPKAERTNPVSS
jgi:hypothetical protein